MPDPAGHTVLQTLLDRLLAGLLNGPGLNCRPHASRQRIDLTALARLQDTPPTAVLTTLLSETRKAKLLARVPAPAPASKFADRTSTADSRESQDPAQRAWSDQQTVFTKLRNIAEDARTYEQDTGVHVLALGFPLLSVPAGSAGAGASQSKRRILAPIAFMPVTLTVTRGSTPSITLEPRAAGADLITPNDALLAWLEQRHQTASIDDLFPDTEGAHPWREIAALVRHIAKAVNLPVPPPFNTEDRDDWQPDLANFQLTPAPKADDDTALTPAILNTAVLGLFPMANQALIRDTKALLNGEPLPESAQSFVKVATAPPDQASPVTGTGTSVPVSSPSPKRHEDERLVSTADPCQARAVRLARSAHSLVIHGPPGTGKSQTITNVIGDHLARGQRVLMVCDKRTALDVVYHRLAHLGLANLCAVIHDPQRDQRPFYKSIRAQIDDLVDTKPPAGTDQALQKVDDELTKLHADLTRHRAALMDRPTESDPSVHDLIGHWLALPDPPLRLSENTAALPVHDFTTLLVPLAALFRRTTKIDYPHNPWTQASAGVALNEFMSLPMTDVRANLATAVTAARNADATLDPAIPPFVPTPSPTDQATARAKLADAIEKALATPHDVRAHWSAEHPNVARSAWDNFITKQAADVDSMRSNPLDLALMASAAANLPTGATAADQVRALEAYLRVAPKWYAAICFPQKRRATAVLARYGLPLTPDNARRVHGFVQGLILRTCLSGTCHMLAGRVQPGLLPDAEIDRTVHDHAAVLELLFQTDFTPALAPLRPLVVKSLTDPTAAQSLLTGLRKSPARATAITGAQDALTKTRVIGPAALAASTTDLLANKPIAEAAGRLNDSVNTLEDVLRATDALANLPAPLRPAARQLIDAKTDPEMAISALHKSVLAGEINRRLAAAPDLRALDAHHLQESFNRYRLLTRSKRSLVRDAILAQWTTRQRDRLLASTGSRLNSQGADLKRRFMLNGDRAIRLRKVIELGAAKTAGPASPDAPSSSLTSDLRPLTSPPPAQSSVLSTQSSVTDPLFDLRPVWLASPETVAQLFPRTPMFDVVIFDEASQLRLEEALPVLTRARRVVIAGDQKQLPPTRFFESAATESEAAEPETEQELFETQQSSTEDLLSAALNTEIQESYLDVHYRSRNADLIEFSNQHFYGSRLQPIPAHPKNRTRFAPLTLEHVNGTYDKSANPAEADRVAQIVRDLLKRADPPSIGIACFNVVQRDLILDKLDDLAAADPEFAPRLAAARTRVGQGSFEGLFVKNLENVQGDERDHIIISTTYGPDPKGRFYRRFGPLASAGGGRRLNVLVTRARDEVHLVTSVPREAYRALPPVPAGTVPTGAYLLFAYLQYAEDLVTAYTLPSPGAPGEGRVRAEPESDASVQLNDPATASPFATAFGKRLATTHNLPSTVNWGNPGFCIDLALRHPARPDDVTLGLLTDYTRYANAEDPVEWDLFRTDIHESQGWRLHRLWTPHYFRDPTAAEAHVAHAVQHFLANELPPDDLPVTPAP